MLGSPLSTLPNKSKLKGNFERGYKDFFKLSILFLAYMKKVGLGRFW
jgi:hypothetical protein